MMISIIIPVYHEQKNLSKLLSHVKQLKHQDLLKEVIIVRTQDDVYENIPTVLSPHAGRSFQMNHGASLAQGDILLFLHADTFLPEEALLLIHQHTIGAFSLEFDCSNFMYKLIGFATSLRSKLLHFPYGDQGIFMPKHIFEDIGGYPETLFLEDVLLVEKLRPKVLSQRVISSCRRYKKHGVLNTLLRNRLIMLGYSLGISPEKLFFLRKG